MLLPASTLFAVFLMSQGVIQNFSAYKEVTLIDPVTYQVPKNGPVGQPLKDEKGNPVTETTIVMAANTPFYNRMLDAAMWFGRFAMIVPILAVAGSLASKKRHEVTVEPCRRMVRCSSRCWSTP